jgi:hypothetical protein
MTGIQPRPHRFDGRPRVAVRDELPLDCVRLYLMLDHTDGSVTVNLPGGDAWKTIERDTRLVEEEAGWLIPVGLWQAIIDYVQRTDRGATGAVVDALREALDVERRRVDGVIANYHYHPTNPNQES